MRILYIKFYVLFCVEMSGGSHYIAQAGLELPGSSDLSVSAPIAGAIGTEILLCPASKCLSFDVSATIVWAWNVPQRFMC